MTKIGFGGGLVELKSEHVEKVIAPELAGFVPAHRIRALPCLAIRSNFGPIVYILQ